jgi:hypothetical protein
MTEDEVRFWEGLWIWLGTSIVIIIIIFLLTSCSPRTELMSKSSRAYINYVSYAEINATFNSLKNITAEEILVYSALNDTDVMLRTRRTTTRLYLQAYSTRAIEGIQVSYDKGNVTHKFIFYPNSTTEIYANRAILNLTSYKGVWR